MKYFLSNRSGQLSTYLIKGVQELPIEIVRRGGHDLLVVVRLLGGGLGSRAGDLALFKLIGKLFSVGWSIVAGVHFYSN